MTNEIIEKYLHNRLSEGERSEFEKRLKEDPSLAEQVELEKDIHIAIDLIARLKKKEQVADIASRQNAPGRVLIYRIAAAIAILILLGVGFLVVNRTYSDEALIAGYYSLFQRDLTVKGSSNEHILNDAMARYESGQFELAHQSFSQLPENLEEQGLVLIFKGNCELELGRYDQAVNTFTRATGESEQYGETARWYLAITYLKLSDEENAKKVLNQIREGEYNFTKAQQLLNRLSSPLRRLPGMR